MSQLSRPLGPSDHVQGDDGAELELVEYGDYECPHCAAAVPVVQAVRRKLGGRLKFAFRNFPLSQMHAHAERAAEAAEAAAAQGSFWQMHDELFAHQNALQDADLESYAAKLGLDVERFRKELAANTYEADVKADFMSGVRSGVNGTPSFFVNGQRFNGNLSAESLAGALEAA